MQILTFKLLKLFSFTSFLFFISFEVNANELKGAWIKKSTGELINFKTFEIADIYLNRKFNDLKNIKYKSCVSYGGNICFYINQFKCSFRYSFTKDILNMQYRYTQFDNQKYCMALYGDYTKVDNQTN